MSFILDEYYPAEFSCLQKQKLLPVNPKFDLSLIIPLYNSEKFIERCIKNLIEQITEYTFEIIFVNDGSTDSTEVVVERFQKLYPDLIKIVSQTNQGISAARNVGILKSEGRYLGFVDHDDLLDPNYIQNLVKEAYLTDSDIVKCSFRTVFNKGRTIETRTNSFRKKSKLQDELTVIPGLIWGGIYKREIFEMICFPNNMWFEDMIVRNLIYRIANSFSYIDSILYTKIEHKSNASKVIWKKNNLKALDQLYLSKQIYKDSLSLGLEMDIYAFNALTLELGSFLYWRINKLPESIQKAAFKEATLLANDIVNHLGISIFDLCLSKEQSLLLNGRFYKWKRYYQNDRMFAIGYRLLRIVSRNRRQ